MGPLEPTDFDLWQEIIKADSLKGGCGPPSTPNIAARASNLPAQTQTLVLATSGWLEISSLYVNPRGSGAIRPSLSNHAASDVSEP